MATLTTLLSASAKNPTPTAIAYIATVLMPPSTFPKKDNAPLAGASASPSPLKALFNGEITLSKLLNKFCMLSLKPNILSCQALTAPTIRAPIPISTQPIGPVILPITLQTVLKTLTMPDIALYKRLPIVLTPLNATKALARAVIAVAKCCI